MTTDGRPAPTNPLSLVMTHWVHRADQRVRVVLGLNERGGFIMSVPERIDVVETVADLATLEADWERVKWMPGWFTEAEAAKVKGT